MDGGTEPIPLWKDQELSELGLLEQGKGGGTLASGADLPRLVRKHWAQYLSVRSCLTRN